MIEVALVFDKDGKTLLWHLPPGRTGGSIPDSFDLWQFLWDNRKNLGGLAHTHPWRGEAWPSHTDTTTFTALEKGLGQRLLWPIITLTEVKYFMRHVVTDEYVVVRPQKIPPRIEHELEIEELLRLSGSS